MSIFKNFGNWEKPKHDIMVSAEPRVAEQTIKFFNENKQYEVVVEHDKNETRFYVTATNEDILLLGEELESITRRTMFEKFDLGASSPFENGSTRLPTADEMSEISPYISDSIRVGGESGGGTLSTGEKYYWTLEGTSVANDTFVREYIANLVDDGHSEGSSPDWSVSVSVSFSETVEENLNDVISDMFSDEDEMIGDEDGLFNEFPDDDDGSTTARDEGIAAQKNGLQITDNPYNPLSDDYNEWDGGFRSSDDDMIEGDNDDVEFDSIAPKIPR